MLFYPPSHLLSDGLVRYATCRSRRSCHPPWKEKKKILNVVLPFLLPPTHFLMDLSGQRRWRRLRRSDHGHSSDDTTELLYRYLICYKGRIVDLYQIFGGNWTHNRIQWNMKAWSGSVTRILLYLMSWTHASGTLIYILKQFCKYIRLALKYFIFMLENFVSAQVSQSRVFMHFLLTLHCVTQWWVGLLLFSIAWSPYFGNFPAKTKLIAKQV